MKRIKTQLAVIGAGPGGYTAALRAAQLGVKVCLIERGELGGVCLNRGCIPTKTLVASAELYSRIKRATEFGIDTTDARPNMERIIGRKNDVVNRLVSGIGFLMNKYGVDVIKGEARFLSDHELMVTGTEGETVLMAKDIIIATGTEPMVPETFGYDGERVITSDEALEQTQLPERLVVIGGGVMGCEFASVFRALGAEVTVVEMLPSLLSTLDDELGKHLALAFRKRGISTLTGVGVESILKESDEAVVLLGNGEVIRAEKVLIVIGRKPLTSELGLEAAGIQTDQRGRIPVNAGLQTMTQHIYAIGDVNSMNYDLAHTATFQGLAVVDTLYGSGRAYRDVAVPNCVFTDPEIATVGLTVKQAETLGVLFKTGKALFAANGKAQAMGAAEGWVKILAEEKSGRILGVHIFGAHASDLIAEATLAVEHGMTTEELTQTIHAHPTLPEAVMEAAMMVRWQE